MKANNTCINPIISITLIAIIIIITIFYFFLSINDNNGLTNIFHNSTITIKYANTSLKSNNDPVYDIGNNELSKLKIALYNVSIFFPLSN